MSLDRRTFLTLGTAAAAGAALPSRIDGQMVQPATIEQMNELLAVLQQSTGQAIEMLEMNRNGQGVYALTIEGAATGQGWQSFDGGPLDADLQFYRPRDNALVLTSTRERPIHIRGMGSAYGGPTDTPWIVLNSAYTNEEPQLDIRMSGSRRQTLNLNDTDTNLADFLDKVIG